MRRKSAQDAHPGQRETETAERHEGRVIKPARTSRFLSLDALRGLAILLMLLVNNFGYARQTPLQLRHANWEGGVHLADMAFPWFLFCVGVAIPFSAASAKRRGQSAWQFDLRALRRTLILLALGALLDSAGDRRFIPFSIGVLQTIGISYLIGAMLYDLAGYRRAAVAGVFLVGYWAAIQYLPAPGMGTGAFEEGRNFILHLNRTYLGQVGLWNLPRIIPCTALVLIGTNIGDLARLSEMGKVRKAAWLLLIGSALVGLGFIWNLDLPFNKPIWTPSYILLSAGTGTFLLGTLDITIDSAGLRKWGFPLIVFGSNAILAYVLPILVKSVALTPLHVYVGGWLRVSLFTLFWWTLLWLLYRRKLFIKI